MGSAPHPIFFPHPALQVMLAFIIFVGFTTITHCISRRLQNETLTFRGIRHMPWPRMAVILMFLDSWLFMLSSGLLIFGVGLEYSSATCIAAAYSCIIFYSSAKFFVYAFLAEKVHIVWSPSVGERRLESPVYLTCIVSVSLYCIVMTLMLGGPIHEIRDNGACVIGLKSIASIPLLVYDLYINIFLTGMFLFPLVRSRVMSSGIRRLAVRTCIAAFFALTTSTVNVVVLIVLDGRELAWVNLGACGADIIVNALAIFWVSGRKHSNNSNGPDHGRRLHPAHSPGHIESDTITSGSFPKYLEGDVNDERPGHFPRSGMSWVDRLLARERSSQVKGRQLQIAVTREYDTQQHSQIELQPRPDSHSEVDVDDKAHSLLPHLQSKHSS
ncbi:hypothetical protein CPC08DRAFT_334914 [Agrocybe pediades]|nr:hypothetical protein CPC08DRAFT_334914 [Agrocybe pediades]